MKMTDIFRDECGGELRKLGLGLGLGLGQVGQDLEIGRGGTAVCTAKYDRTSRRGD